MTNLQKVNKQGKLLVKVSSVLAISLILNIVLFWQFLNKTSDYADCMYSLTQEVAKNDFNKGV
jgi:regulatory protein YycI of two-component signal transduction system YycFG